MYFPNIWVPVCGRAIKILLGGKGTKLFAGRMEIQLVAIPDAWADPVKKNCA